MIRSNATFLAATLATVIAPLVGDTASIEPSRLSTLVRAIEDADFQGRREELRRLAESVREIRSSELRAYAEYWRGFALWRSAINGSNETPMPADVASDLEGAVRAFEAALLARPDWIEPRIGLIFCWVGQSYAPGSDPSKRESLRKSYEGVVRVLEADGQENPRALWFLGGKLFFAPPAAGGDPAQAAATYRRALRAAREEAVRNAGASTPAWVPAWGSAENLMSLAYLYSHGPNQDRDLARAYADGALAVAPQWHYVRDVLTPQIEALAARPGR